MVFLQGVLWTVTRIVTRNVLDHTVTVIVTIYIKHIWSLGKKISNFKQILIDMAGWCVTIRPRYKNTEDFG